MELKDFKKVVFGSEVYEDLQKPLQSLLVDFQGDWDTAHSIVQNENTSDAAWVHAYLHRKEGDLGNARYWYSNAGKKYYSDSLEKEWESIAISLLKKLK